MTEPAMPQIDCTEFDESVGELVLDLLAPQACDRLLHHAETCARCRAELHSLTEVADLLPGLAPECEPPIGFEARVLAAIAPAPATGSRGRGRLLLAAAAALLVAVAGGTWLGATLADDAPSAATAATVLVGDLQAADGSERGWVVLSSGTTAELTMHLSNLAVGTYRCLLEAADGTATQVATWPIGPSGSGQWTVPVDAELHPVRVVLLDGEGAAIAEATLTATSA
ncbi:MAG: hypothetical protein Q7V57_00355 [Actinomycetota bacterium]|nr:hypothetical protein [Actinomycetota bacterium]